MMYCCNAAEAYMAVGVLSDNTTTYSKGVDLFNTTVSDYLKWGKGSYTSGRVLGECSETLRDMYHSQFGLGGEKCMRSVSEVWSFWAGAGACPCTATVLA
eukprot:GHUV01049721.1.p1 GENE.GHUV01049721.1~~GHUV01049721.1.p1  ORF type:complete len:100 (-),score=18.16 GHUV01049721.1:307-606(-)